MKVKEILTKKEGEKLFLLGNEAAVRRGLESGVSIISTYPSTPSSEIGNVFIKKVNLPRFTGHQVKSYN